MAQTVAQHSIASFTSPTNGTSPIDANTVRGNDNTIRSSYNDHDADPGIHVQSSALASRPAAGDAGRKWLTTDTGAIKMYFDTGSVWSEISYLPLAGGTVSGNVSITGTLGVTSLITATGGVSGNLTGNVTGNVTGNAGTATALATARTINGTSFDGTANITITANTTNALTAGTYLTSTGTFNGSTARTFAVDATDANTASKVVARDASGNFAAGTITASLSGNATTATTADKVANALTAGTYLTSGGTFDGAAARTFAVDATSANTVSKVVARDSSGNFSAGTITAALTGNASTATALATARTINGTSFDGTANITITAANPNALTLGTYLTGTSYDGSGAVTTAVDAATASTASKVVARDSGGAIAAKSLKLDGSSSGTVTVAPAAAAGTWTATLPTSAGSNGQVLTTDGSGTLSWTTAAGGGGTTTNSLTAGSYLTGGTFNGSTAVTFAVDATDANTASKVVARDGSGNFSAGTITAALSGNASTATALQTARTINGTSFDGTANITVTAAAGTLTGTTLNSGVTASSLTSVGTLTNLSVTNTITGSISGNAGTATTLATARNINGVSFNGSADITVTAAAGTLSGSTLASGVTASSLTSVGTLTGLTVSGTSSLDGAVTVNDAGADVDFRVEGDTEANLLFADASTDRIGIGTNTPAHRFHLVGTGYIQQMIERATVSATAATGTINYDALTQAVLFYTSNASANWTVNLRGSSTVSMATLLAVGDSITLTFLVTQGSTPYYASAHQIDGSSVTPKWQGGTAPTAGNASGIDIYTYTVIKTAATPTYTVLASQTKFT